MRKQLWATVLAFFGIAAFAEANGKKLLTDEQKKRLTETFGEPFLQKLQGTFDSDTDEALTNEAIVQIAEMQTKLSALETEKSALEAEKTTLATDKTALQAEKATLESQIAANSKLIDDQKKAIQLLSTKPEEDPKVNKPGNPAVPAWDETNASYLGGVEKPYFAIDDAHAYNKRAYSEIMKRRGISVPVPMSSSSLDYTTLKADLGDYYRVRKQDRIQSFLMSLPSLEKIFPLESGYQDQAVLVNMFLLNDFSQADNTGSSFDNVVNGGFKFEQEILTMYDVMFAHKFTNLKELEKTWIGYLNREGSSTMKWSFIEYIMIEVTKKLQNERENRRINGEKIAAIANTPGTALGAANGFRKFLRDQIAAFKLRPFVLGEWDDTTIAEHIRLGTSYVPAVVRDSGNLVLYLSPDALTAYHRNLESLYGLNQDYKADINYVKDYASVQIQAIPNMAESKRLIWTIKGNFALFEDQPGEMTNYSFEQQDWSLKVWSNWKESLWAYYVGRKWASAAEVPTDYSTQLIFCNDVDFPADYYLPMVADDTTPSVTKHTSLVSVANTVATAITNIDNAVVGQEIRLKCGSVTNAVTIAKSGNFSLLYAAWTPVLNDILVLKKRSDGKFIELSRSNAGDIPNAFAEDDATPSVTGAVAWVTDVNAHATAITNLDNALTGVVYTIYGAGSTYASTIANSGNFSLTAAMTLSTGHWIQLQKSASDGIFYEINRA